MLAELLKAVQLNGDNSMSFRTCLWQTAESLVELVKAVMWSAGNVAAAARSGENTATGELCLVRRPMVWLALLC